MLASLLAGTAAGAAAPGHTAASYRFRPVFDGLAGLTHIAAPRSAPRKLYLVQQFGVIRIAVDGKLQPKPFLDISRLTVSRVEMGLHSVAFSPNYVRNHLFYVAYNGRDWNTRVVEYRANAAGTGIVAGPATLGSPHGTPDELTAAGDKLFFHMDQPGVTGDELWVSDGTAANTRYLEIQGGTPSGAPSQLTAVGRMLFFIANNGADGREPWRSDGTVRGTTMVQPFVQEVESDGEWSLQFFGGVFSHAVRKYAAVGDFRVTREWGGWHEAVTPPPNVIREAERALRVAPGESLYARVDGVIRTGSLVVTELELLEPSLYLDADPDAPMRFAQAIAARL